MQQEVVQDIDSCCPAIYALAVSFHEEQCETSRTVSRTVTGRT